MANILLGATGSVAAIRIPDLYRALRSEGYAVKIIATKAATYFFDPAAIDSAVSAKPARNRDIVILDEDEWSGERYQRDDPVLHIELRRWADLLLVAPLDANTLAKFACGLSDNCLTCVWRAWDTAKPMLLALAMNTLMWQHPLTVRHLRQLAADAGIDDTSTVDEPETLIAAINERSRALRIVGPQVKRLACGDTGIGAMAEIADILAAVRLSLQEKRL
jgi:phosphopantothenoylcysteine decarboxylase